MRPWLILTTLLCPLQLSYAFYPYHLPDTSIPTNARHAASSTTNLKREDTTRSGSSLVFSLKRLPHDKRENGFSTVPAAAPKQANSLGVAQDGTDFSYFASVQFGSSSKSFLLLLDSAASNTWVMGGGCKSGPCGVHTTLGSGDSSSLKMNSDTFSVSYGTGMVAGTTASDTLKTLAFSVPMTFGLATQVSDDFNSYAMDGILALGRADQVSSGGGSNTNVKAPTLLDALVSQKIITSKQFGLHLWRSADGGSNDGEINFGAPDTSRYSGDLNYITAIKNTNGFWEIGLDDAGVGGKRAGLTGRTAIIDSGTSFVLMPTDDAAKLHALIPGSTQNGETFTVPCNSQAAVQLVFGGRAYGISPKDYIGKSSGSGGDCVSNIVGHQTFGSSQWLVGDVFLKNVYAVFDFDGARVGFGTIDVGGSASSSATQSSGVVTGATTVISSSRSGSALSTASAGMPSRTATVSVSMIGLLPTGATNSVPANTGSTASTGAMATSTQGSSATGRRSMPTILMIVTQLPSLALLIYHFAQA